MGVERFTAGGGVGGSLATFGDLPDELASPGLSEASLLFGRRGMPGGFGFGAAFP